MERVNDAANDDDTELYLFRGGNYVFVVFIGIMKNVLRKIRNRIVRPTLFLTDQFQEETLSASNTVS